MLNVRNVFSAAPWCEITSSGLFTVGTHPPSQSAKEEDNYGNVIPSNAMRVHMTSVVRRSEAGVRMSLRR